MREIVEKSGKFLASHIGDFVFEHHCADVPRLVEPRLSLSHFAEAMFMPVYGVEDFEVTAVAVAVSVANFEYIEFLLRMLVIDAKFNGCNVADCHNKNDALLLVFPKISASLSDKTKTECVFISFSSLAYRMVVVLHIYPTIFLLEADNSLFSRNWLKYLR